MNVPRTLWFFALSVGLAASVACGGTSAFEGVQDAVVDVRPQDIESAENDEGVRPDLRAEDVGAGEILVPADVSEDYLEDDAAFDAVPMDAVFESLVEDALDLLDVGEDVPVDTALAIPVGLVGESVPEGVLVRHRP